MGPIYGTLFSEMGEAIGNIDQIDKVRFSDMLHAAVNGLREFITAQVGDKTLMDALIPAVDAYDTTMSQGGDFKKALLDMKAAAERGRDATKDMIAKVGRASRLGERSRGVLDAGATSCALLLGAMVDQAIALLD
jgi:dihydroxyacetone kinase-like protein